MSQVLCSILSSVYDHKHPRKLPTLTMLLAIQEKKHYIQYVDMNPVSTPLHPLKPMFGNKLFVKGMFKED